MQAAFILHMFVLSVGARAQVVAETAEQSKPQKIEEHYAKAQKPLDVNNARSTQCKHAAWIANVRHTLHVALSCKRHQ